MHPNNFFNEVSLRTAIDTVEVFDEDLKNKLQNVHPKNFIKSKVTLPVFKVVMSYETSKGNYKQTEKYMVMDASNNSEEDGFEDCWADMMAQDYAEEHKLKNVSVLDVYRVCDAVLQIG